jgi:DNA processing protein
MGVGSMSTTDGRGWAADTLFGAAADPMGAGRAPTGASSTHRASAGPAGSIGVGDAERAARALLSRVAEPAEPRLGAAMQQWGPVEVVARLREGALEVPGAAAMRARMVGLDGTGVLETAAAAGAVLVCPGDPEWPDGLDDLGRLRPWGLWVRAAGGFPAGVAESVAIVGSRVATPYGIHVATEFAGELTERGWSVVSGCAFGIDVAAHRGALAAGGYTVGVLAGGVDVPYPLAHAALIDRMAGEGALVSESAPGSAPARRRFLTRNRIIAALSRGTVVVEAAVRSGAATTARWADELGRPLMVVPGPITSALSAGSNELLRSRHAIAVTRPAEVIEAIGRLGADLAPVRASAPRPRDRLPARLLVVLEALPGRGAATGDRVAREAGVPDALPMLGELAALGLVERVDGGWRLTRLARASAARRG